MSSHKRKDVAKRTARVHGHVHGIMKMIEDGRSYSEIVQQISAVKSALDGAVEVIVEDLVEDCIAKSNKRDQESVLELKQVVSRMK